MKVRIIQAGGPNYWYAKMIGQVVEVEKDEELKDHYNAGSLSKYGMSGTGVIFADDCVVVEEGEVKVGTIVEVIDHHEVWEGWDEMFNSIGVQPEHRGVGYPTLSSTGAVISIQPHFQRPKEIVHAVDFGGKVYLLARPGFVVVYQSTEGKQIGLQTISQMFEEKVASIRPYIEGEKVHYDDGFKKENGIIKQVRETEAFVVYKCADDWENYANYTGVLTDLTDLKRGWI